MLVSSSLFAQRERGEVGPSRSEVASFGLSEGGLHQGTLLLQVNRRRPD